MDFDLSTPSVTDALGDLQRKAQSLMEDRELYTNLEAKAHAEFERHRAELTLLLQKERAIHAAAEDRLRESLQRLLRESEAIRVEIATTRESLAPRPYETSDRSAPDACGREAQQCAALRAELDETRAACDALGAERTWHAMQLREALAHQHALRAAFVEADRSPEGAEGVGGCRRPRCGRVFLPPDRTHPSTQHIGAIVSTVERRNGLTPRRRTPSARTEVPAGGGKRAPPLTADVRAASTGSGRHLDALCRSLLRDVLRLRREYQQCNAHLEEEEADAVGVSRRIREIIGETDRKVQQLRSLREQQAKVEDRLRLHDMMLEIAAENDYCESIYSDLLELIRS